MNGKWRCLVAAVIAFPGMVAACTTGRNDGETHFICSSNADCKLPGEVCLGTRCEPVPLWFPAFVQPGEPSAPGGGDLLPEQGPPVFEGDGGSRVTFAFEGVVDTVNDSEMLVAPGDSIAGTYSYVSRSLELVGKVDAWYVFDDDDFDVFLRAGAVTAHSIDEVPSQPGSAIFVRNDGPPGGVTETFSLDPDFADTLMVSASELRSPINHGERMGLRIILVTDGPSDVFTTTDAPVVTVDVSAFATNSIEAGGIQGHLTSLVRVTDDAQCGNGAVDAGEECDDGNVALGDGCDFCRYSCVAGDPDRGCSEGGDPCAGFRACDETTHRCPPPAVQSDMTLCGENRHCLGGECLAIDVGSPVHTYEFEGVVSYAGQQFDYLGVASGDPITGVVSFDEEMATTRASGPDVFELEEGVFAVSARFGAVALLSRHASGEARLSEVLIENGIPGSGPKGTVDLVSFKTNEARIIGESSPSVGFSLLLSDTTGAALSSASISSVGPSLRLEDFDSRTVTLTAFGSQITGTVTSLTKTR